MLDNDITLFAILKLLVPYTGVQTPRGGVGRGSSIHEQMNLRYRKKRIPAEGNINSIPPIANKQESCDDLETFRDTSIQHPRI